MAAPTPLDTSILEEDELLLYNDLFERDAKDGGTRASSFYNNKLGEIDLQDSFKPEVIEPPPSVDRYIPGMENLDSIEPGIPQETIDRIKAIDQAGMIMDVEGLLDEKSKEVYLSAVDRFKSEGFPDRDMLRKQFQFEYDDMEDTSMPDLGDANYGDYAFGLMEYTQGKLSGVETAQSRAKKEVFKLEPARKPRSATPYSITPTPVSPGQLQRNPELQAEMTTGQVVKEALSPQILTTGEQARTVRAQRKLRQSEVLEQIAGLQESEGISSEEATKLFFQTYEDMIRSQIITGQIGEGVSDLEPGAMFSLIGADDDQRVEINRGVDNAARRIVRDTISDVYGFPDDRIESGAGKKTPREETLLAEFGLLDGMESAGYIERSMDTLTFLLEGATSTRWDADARARYVRAGIIDDEDAITESMGMAIVRDLNLPFRAVINPAMSGLENIGLIERKADVDETDTILPARRIELTEDATGVTGMADAYIREIMIETATMRGLGNDVGQLDSALFGLIDGSSDSVSRDFLVGAGTFAEIIMPVGIVKGVGITGKLGKSAARLTKAGPKAQTGIAKGLEIAGDFALSGGNPLYPLVKQGTLGLNTLGRSLPNYAVLAKASKVAKNTPDGQTIANTLKPKLLDELIDTSMTPKAKIADEVSDQMTAYAIMAGPGDGAILLEKAFNAGTISSRSFSSAFNLSPQDAKTLLSSLAKSDDSRLIAMGATEALSATTDDLVKGLAKTRIRDEVMDVMAGSYLGDYVMLTDRMVVSQSWLQKNNKAIIEHFTDAAGNNRLIDSIDDTGTFIKVDPSEITTTFQVRDNYLNSILAKVNAGENVNVYEFSYLTNRMTESFVKGDEVLRRGSGAFNPTSADVLRDATVPVERRIENPLRDGSRVIDAVYQNFAPTKLQNFISRQTKKVLGQPVTPGVQIDSNRAMTKLFKDGTEAEISRLERIMPAAFANVSRELRGILGIPNVLDNLNLPMTNLSRLSVGGKTGLTYELVMKLQKGGLSMGDIAGLTSEQMAAAITRITNAEQGLMGRAGIALQNQQILKLYFGPSFGRDAVQTFLITEPRLAGYSIFTMGRGSDTKMAGITEAIEIIEKAFPEMVKGTPRRLQDVMTATMVQTEMKSIINRNLRATFGSQPMALDIRANVRALGLVGEQADNYPKLIQDLVTERLATGKTYYDMTPLEINEILVKNGFTINPGNPVGGIARLDDGASMRIGNYLEANAIKYDIAPEQFLDRWGYKLQANREVNLLGDASSGVEPLKVGQDLVPITKMESDAIDTFLQAFGSPASTNLNRNMAALAKKGDAGQYATDMINHYANGLRRTLVSGQLGGKYLPNIPYHAENLLTASLIAYVTNPKYVLNAIGQTAKNVFGITPYRQLRYMNAMYPEKLLPGTRYSYKEAYNLFNTQNLGISNAGINLGDSFYRDLESIAGGWNRFTRGVPGAGAPVNAKLLKDHLAGMASFGRRITTDTASAAAEIRKPLTGTSSPFMRWADETDRSFREAAFIKSLQNGDSAEVAAKIARETFLDYGSMPSWMKSGFLKSALYLSFTAVSSAELLRALATPKGVLRVSAMANYHRNLSRQVGAWNYDGDKSMQYVWAQPFEDGSGYNSYVRSPYISNIAVMSNLIGFGAETYTRSQEAGKLTMPEDGASRAIEGMADFFYFPMIDFARQLDADYKKGVPAKQVLAMQEGSYGYQFYSMNPMSFITGAAAGGQPAAYFFDRYDIEVKPMDRVTGSATFGGRQFRFRSKEGYNQYLFDNLLGANIGTTRGFNDYIYAYYLANPDKLPANVDLKTAQEPGGYIDVIQYMFLRQRMNKIPKELQIEYRAVKESQRRLQEQLKKYEK